MPRVETPREQVGHVYDGVQREKERRRQQDAAAVDRPRGRHCERDAHGQVGGPNVLHEVMLNGPVSGTPAGRW